MPEPELFLYKKNIPWDRYRIWPESADIFPSGIVQENTDYYFELTGVTTSDQVELIIDDIPLVALRPKNNNTALWQWSIGYYAGSVSGRILLPNGRQLSFEVISDPDLRKLTRDDFNQMVKDILEDTLALLSISSFRKGIAKGRGKVPPPVVRLEFIRSRIEEIETVIRQINDRPVRVLRGKPEWIESSKAKNLSSNEFMHSMINSQMTPVSNQDFIRRLPPSLKGYFPSRVQKNARDDSVNIREHQEIKNALEAWISLMDAYASILITKETNDTEINELSRIWASRCRSLAQRLRSLLELPLFINVSDRANFPVISQIYRRIPIYRKFFQLYQEMNLGVSEVTGDFLMLPLSRTYDLYELWAFLRIIRALSMRFDSIVVDNLFPNYSPESGSLVLPSGNVIVPITESVVIAFQREYIEFWREISGRGSFSRHMVPDISFEIASTSGIVNILILDAK